MAIITRKGTWFWEDEKKYYVTGCNYYNLLFSPHETIIAALDEMKELGVNTVRIWGFNHNEGPDCMENPKGVYHEPVFRTCDFVMEEACKRGIRIMIVFENYWFHYGGIKARVQWEGLEAETSAQWAQFYTNPSIKEGYKAYIHHFVERVNTINGKKYAEDDTLFAWELMNEPRYQDVSEEENHSGATLRKWIDEMAGYVKELDPRHMVGLGIEGHGEKYGFAGDEGNPFVFCHQSPYVDFCTAHPYPDSEWANLSPEQSCELVRNFIRDAHEQVGKPFIMEEFNTTRFEDYHGYWKAMYQAVEELDAAGDMFWCYMYQVSSGYNMCREDAVVQEVFVPHAKKLHQKMAKEL